MKEAKKAVADKLAAEEIEAKKTVRKAARTVKEVKEEAAAQVKEVVADKLAAEEIEAKKTVRKVARTAVETAAQSDAAVAEKIEAKKTVRKTARKAKEAVEPVVEDTKKAARHASLSIIIQSPMGGAISTDEIAKKVPKGTDAVYVRVDENMLYWVKGKETGSVNIW
jgi:hypothetical protein